MLLYDLFSEYKTESIKRQSVLEVAGDAPAVESTMGDTSPIAMAQRAREGRLSGRTAIVTGAGSSGDLASIGMAIAVVFAANGAAVVILDRDEGRAENTRRTILGFGGKAEIFIGDITDEAACRASAEFAHSTFGRLDVLANSAGIAPAERYSEKPLWDDIVALNLTAAKLMSDAVIPYMTAQGAGAVVNISSNAGLRGGAGIAYTAAKSGMIGLTKAMAFEYGRSGIRFNSVAPGHVHTPMGISYANLGPMLTGARRLRAEAGLLGTEGTAWDVAYAALFLASDEARWVTAHTIPVDAGTTEVLPFAMFPLMSEAAAVGLDEPLT
jgi:NAD(P)-dependent dehydrogenase (short-subunit alcohol dehydrogenase family)